MIHERAPGWNLAMVVLAVAVLPAVAIGQSYINASGITVFDSRWNEQAFVEIAANANHTVARRSDGSVVAWGDNYGRMCDIPAGTYTKISTGQYHTVAVRSDGSIGAWGSNAQGQCNVPSWLYYDVVAGSLHNVARLSNGSLVFWGNDSYGQCNGYVGVNPPLGNSSFSKIAAGGRHTLALFLTNPFAGTPNIWTWGSNAAGQRNVPALPSGYKYLDVVGGWDFSVGIRGTYVSFLGVWLPVDAVAWGGIGSPPALAPGDKDLVASAGRDHAMSIRNSGLVAWGDNTYSQCNVPALPAGLSWAQSACGDYHSAGRRSDGSVVAWGNNQFNQCNTPPLGTGQFYVEIAAGATINNWQSYHHVGRRSDGSVVAWGNNGSGQCNVPPLPAGLSYVEVAAGSSHSLARRSDGSIVGWGNAGAVPAGNDFVEIDAHLGNHSVARRSNGTAVCWGSNAYGQCNTLPLPAGLAYVEVAAGEKHTVARRSNGSVVAWGDPADGKLNVPAAVMDCVEIAAGGKHSLARLKDGSVVGWGYNGNGQCNVPLLPIGVKYVQIAAGWDYSVARLSSGSVVAWGGGATGDINVPAWTSLPAAPAGFQYVDVEANLFHTAFRYSASAAAKVEYVASGCGGAGSPFLNANAPALGRSFQVELWGGTPNTTGGLFYSLVPPAPIDLGTGCWLSIDYPTVQQLLTFTTTSAGTWTMSPPMQVPADPAVVGAQYMLQAVQYGTAGPQGFDASNGVKITIGN